VRFVNLRAERRRQQEAVNHAEIDFHLDVRAVVVSRFDLARAPLGTESNDGVGERRIVDRVQAIQRVSIFLTGLLVSEPCRPHRGVNHGEIGIVLGSRRKPRKVRKVHGVGFSGLVLADAQHVKVQPWKMAHRHRDVQVERKAR
jgi:hypothetical protein